MDSSSLVETAFLIGERLLAGAIHDGDACTWQIVVHDRARAGRASIVKPATAELYQGTAGIALFLAELWAVTGDSRFLLGARRAMRHCERTVAQEPVQAGLYSGNVGIALSSARVAQLTHDEEWRSIALRSIANLDPELHYGLTDVISGAAGTILGLLRVATILDVQGLREVAVRYGIQLESTARRWPSGWSWESGLAGARQDLCGYAHGASGMAHAFLELFAHTSDARWRFAASRAMSYERSCEVDQSGDWPDFRDMELIQAAASPRSIADFRSRVRSGQNIGRSPLRSTRAWCHGAPGIALTRLRALSLEVDTVFVEAEMLRALAATDQTVRAGADGDHSLCHGTFGNSEALLIARERHGLDEARCVESIIERALSRMGGENGTWVTGVIGGVYDPSLLVGEAGIGHFLLRVACPGVPSVLCVSDWNVPSEAVTPAASELCASELAHLLPVTVRAIGRMPGTLRLSQMVGCDSLPSDFSDSIRALRNAVDSDTSLASEMLRDAVALDAAVLKERLAFNDFREQLYAELIEPSPEEIDWARSLVVRSPHVSVVRTKWAWRRWADNGQVMPDLEDELIVLYRRGQAVYEKSITEFHALILDVLSVPSSLDNVVSAVVASVDADESVLAELPEHITEIIREAVVGGLAQIVDARAVL